MCCARHNDAPTYYIFYYSHFSVIDSAARKLLSRLEAAIGIEPMNKGFAVRPGPRSLSVMECHRPVLIDLFGEPCYSVTLKIVPEPPQKSPQSISSKCERQSTRCLRTNFKPVDFSFVIETRSDFPRSLPQASARISYLKSP
jgi:hypothetical protein